MISIIVPVYNVEKYLCQCIDSLLAQTYRDIEILLIDDGSSDGSGAICDSFAGTDPRIRVFHKEYGGVASARNYGLDQARGEYIGFVDSDDWADPNMFQTLLDILLEADADISVCSYWLEYESDLDSVKDGPEAAAHKNNSIIDTVYRGEESLRALIFRTITDLTWNKLFCKRCFDQIRFPEGKNYEDVATIYRVLLNIGTKAGDASAWTGPVVVSVSTPLYHYRQRSGSIVRNYSMKNLADRYDAYRDRYEFLSIKTGIADKELTDKMLDQIADVIGRTWRWVLNTQSENLDRSKLREMAAFTREHFPVFGHKRWAAYKRVSVFLGRRACFLNFFIARAMTVVYSALFIKDRL